MTEKYQNRYRIPSVRLQHWDYGSNAMYFVTICTASKEWYFGEMVNGVMELSAIGEIVETEWLKTLEIRSDMNVQLGEYIIMPNHFHAIIIIGENRYNKNQVGTDADCRDAMHCVYEKTSECRDAKHCDYGKTSECRDAMHCVSTETTPTNATNTPNYAIEHKNKFGPQSKNLASIIRGFKSAVTINARKYNPKFAWQSRFHEHIIRNNDSYQRITQYISNNPANWVDDVFYK